MSRCNEYNCDCIVHTIAGTIRKCPALGSRTLSGKRILPSDDDVRRHNDAREVRVYRVASIRP